MTIIPITTTDNTNDVVIPSSSSSVTPPPPPPTILRSTTSGSSTSSYDLEQVVATQSPQQREGDVNCYNNNGCNTSVVTYDESMSTVDGDYVNETTLGDRQTSLSSGTATTAITVAEPFDDDDEDAGNDDFASKTKSKSTKKKQRSHSTMKQILYQPTSLLVVVTVIAVIFAVTCIVIVNHRNNESSSSNNAAFANGPNGGGGGGDKEHGSMDHPDGDGNGEGHHDGDGGGDHHDGFGGWGLDGPNNNGTFGTDHPGDDNGGGGNWTDPYNNHRPPPPMMNGGDGMILNNGTMMMDHHNHDGDGNSTNGQEQFNPPNDGSLLPGGTINGFSYITHHVATFEIMVDDCYVPATATTSDETSSTTNIRNPVHVQIHCGNNNMYDGHEILQIESKSSSIQCTSPGGPNIMDCIIPFLAGSNDNSTSSSSSSGVQRIAIVFACGSSIYHPLMEYSFDRMYSTASVHVLPYVTPSYCPKTDANESASASSYITVSMNRVCTTNNTIDNIIGTSSGTVMTTKSLSLSSNVTTTEGEYDYDVNYVLQTAVNTNQSCTVPHRENYGSPYKPLISTTSPNLNVIERNMTTTDGGDEDHYNFCHYTSTTTTINSSSSLSVLSFNEILVFDYYKDTMFNSTTTPAGDDDLVCVNIHDQQIAIDTIAYRNSTNYNNNSDPYQEPPPPPMSPYMMIQMNDTNHAINDNNTNYTIGSDNSPNMMMMPPPRQPNSHYRPISNMTFVWEEIKTLFQLLNHP